MNWEFFLEPKKNSIFDTRKNILGIKAFGYANRIYDN